MRKFFTCVILGIFTASTTYGGKTIYGRDNRKRVRFKRGPQANRLPYSAVVKLRARQHECTGTMIAARVLLTAKHCLTDTQKDEVRVYSHYDRRRFIYRARSVDFKSHPSHDIALIKIDQPLGSYRGVGTLSIGTLSKYKNAIVTLPGYNSDLYRGDRLTVHEDCKVHSVSRGDENLHHDCDSATGSSGGPILFYEESSKTWVIIGVHASFLVPKGHKGVHKISRYAYRWRSNATNVRVWLDEIARAAGLK